MLICVTNMGWLGLNMVFVMSEDYFGNLRRINKKITNHNAERVNIFLFG